MLKRERSRDSVARRSPWVSAPRLSSLFATIEANLCSPARSEMRRTYSGAEIWLLRCVLPNCWIARSALQGSSRVMCTLLFLFFTLLSACKEIPLLAASEMIATYLSPFMNLSFSLQLSISRETDSSVLRDSYLNSPVLSSITTLPFLPVISDTNPGPPNSSINSSNVFAGSEEPRFSIFLNNSSFILIALSTLPVSGGALLMPFSSTLPTARWAKGLALSFFGFFGFFPFLPLLSKGSSQSESDSDPKGLKSDSSLASDTSNSSSSSSSETMKSESPSSSSMSIFTFFDAVVAACRLPLFPVSTWFLLLVLMPSSSNSVFFPLIPSTLVMLPRSGAGKCFSTRDCKTPLEVETKSVNSSSLSTCSMVRASPVLCKPITMHFPILWFSSATWHTCFTFDAMQRYLKKRWWELQNCPHIVFFIRFSASIRSAASVNL